MAVSNQCRSNHGSQSTGKQQTGRLSRCTTERHHGSILEHWNGETDPHYPKLLDGQRPHTIHGKVLHEFDSRNGNPRSHDGETPG